MRVEDAVHGLMNVTARITVLLSWMLVALIHVALLAAALAAAWWLRLTPQDVARWAAALPLSWLAATGGGILAFLGLSGLALVLAYAKAWQWLVRRLANAYVLNFD